MARKTEQKPWKAVKMHMYRVPNIFPENIDFAQRLGIMRAAARKANKDFSNKLGVLQDWFNKHDPLYLLSFCAFYFASSPEGTDPELAGASFFPSHLLEIFQALSLYQERKQSMLPLMNEATNLRKDLDELNEHMQWRMFDIPPELTTEEDIHTYALRISMMGNTAVIRNWAYYHQMKSILIDLSHLIDTDFKRVYNVKCSDFFTALYGVLEERSDLINEYRQKVRGVIQQPTLGKLFKKFNKTFSTTPPITYEFVKECVPSTRITKKKARHFAIHFANFFLPECYSFNIEHFLSFFPKDVNKAAVIQMINLLSYSFGDLSTFNKEHLVLDNPVHKKPFIKVSDATYFTSYWLTLSHYFIDILENFLGRNAELKEKYSRIKAQYLEDRVERTFRENFPSAQIFRGSMWEGYENDLIVVIDTFAIIVESKSRHINSLARRGGPDALRQALQKLIAEPSEQALRFIKHLKQQKGEVTFPTKRKKTNNFNPTKIKYYIPIGITFHHLGAIGSNIKKIVTAKYTDKSIDSLIPSISFTDLESVFSLLRLQSEKIHYLARRREFEAHLDYEADELDLLAFYLDNGFNVGAAEYDGTMPHINMGLKSKELDTYIMGAAQGAAVEKPELAMIPWWRAILKQLESRQSKGWLETTFILLNSTKQDQEKFERKWNQLINKIRSGSSTKMHNYVMFLSGPPKRRYAIVGYIYNDLPTDERDTIIAQILSTREAQDGTRGSVVIGTNIGRMDFPYSVIARGANTHFFD